MPTSIQGAVKEHNTGETIERTQPDICQSETQSDKEELPKRRRQQRSEGEAGEDVEWNSNFKREQQHHNFQQWSEWSFFSPRQRHCHGR